MIPLLVRRAARIEKNALYQHQHGKLQVKNPASPTFCACFFGVRVAKQSSRAKPPPVPKILTCSWRIFSAKKQDQQPQSHTSVRKCTFENTCSYIGTAEQFTHK